MIPTPTGAEEDGEGAGDGPGWAACSSAAIQKAHWAKEGMTKKRRMVFTVSVQDAAVKEG
jgi:hypothetical protein